MVLFSPFLSGLTCVHFIAIAAQVPEVLTIARAFGVICAALVPSCLRSTALPQTVGLVEQFESTTAFWEQSEVAKKIVALGDKSVLPRLELWLRCEDVRRRGYPAFVFARLGDDRGLEVTRARCAGRLSEQALW